jgi:hypothetical protein
MERTISTIRPAVAGAPFPPEPNREETRRAVYLAHGDLNSFGNIAYVRKDYAQAFELLQKIDSEGTDALAALPPDTPRIDSVIDRHVMNLSCHAGLEGAVGLFRYVRRKQGHTDDASLDWQAPRLRRFPPWPMPSRTRRSSETAVCKGIDQRTVEPSGRAAIKPPRKSSQ